jgi:hypothetical protein
MLGFLLTLLATGSASARGTGQGSPEQRKACTPDAYRFRAGEIPIVNGGWYGGWRQPALRSRIAFSEMVTRRQFLNDNFLRCLKSA